MHALFICVLTEHPHRPNMYGPKVQRALLPAVPKMKYVVIPAHEANPVAIGLIQVTTEQFDVLNALSGVWVFDAINWRTRLVSEIPNAIRTRLSDLLNDRNISAGIQLSDTVMQAVGKIVTAVGGNPQQLLAEYMGRTGEVL